MNTLASSSSSWPKYNGCRGGKQRIVSNAAGCLEFPRHDDLKLRIDQRSSTMLDTDEAGKLPKARFYVELATQLRHLTADESDNIANLANGAALLFHSLPRLNWAGFYLLRDGELVLGPFQGRPACVRIPLGRGICGSAAEKRTTLRVADVNAFPGHIACDSASRSEIVLPLISAYGALHGVMDLDSPQLDRFDAEDEAGLQNLAAIVAAKLG